MIQGWLADLKKRGFGRDPDLTAWAAQTAETAKETLIHLLRKYHIQPFGILEIIERYKYEELFHTHRTVRKKLRSAPLRELDAKALDKAVSILDEWWSYLTQETHALELEQYPANTEQIKLVAKTLRDLGPSQKHRATEVRLRCCAQRLAEEFQRGTGWKNLLYEHIGVLIKAAFPNDWNPAGKIRDAAVKMIKGWDYPIRWIDERNYAIWIVNSHLKVIHVNQPAGHLLGVLPWEAAGKDVRFLIRALVPRFVGNSRESNSDFSKNYLKFLQGRGIEWKTNLTLEREVINKFYEKEKQIVDYVFLVQRELGARVNEGTRTYLTEKEILPDTC